MKPTRYAKILREIRLSKAKVILEVGTWNGDRAVEMMDEALRASNSKVSYYGFDLFEDITPAKSKEEFNVKAPHAFESVEKKLSDWTRAHPGTSFHLERGDTKKTLPDWVDWFKGSKFVDLAWIDGGHSVMTILSDWTNVRKVMKPWGVVLFDDYYLGGPIDVSKVGSNGVVASIREEYGWRTEILEPGDPVSGGGIVKIVKVVVG